MTRPCFAKFSPQSNRHRSRSRDGMNGAFSMVELLLAIAIAAVFFAALISVIISYVNSRDRLEAMVRLQDQWGKLQFLLDREMQEATPVTTASSVSSTCRSGDQKLVMEVPGNSNRIVYYLSGTSLRRCGPTISNTGDLSTSVSDSLLLSGVTSFTVDSTDPQRPSFSMTLTAPNGVQYTNQSEPTATTFRTRAIN